MYPKPALLAELGFAIIRARFGKLFGRSSKMAEPSSANGQSFSVPKSLGPCGKQVDCGFWYMKNILQDHGLNAVANLDKEIHISLTHC